MRAKKGAEVVQAVAIVSIAHVAITRTRWNLNWYVQSGNCFQRKMAKRGIRNETV
jgi:hypothetical protein